MTTLTKRTLHLAREEKKEASRRSGWYQRFLEEATDNYFFLISFAILVGSCLGGITVMYILKANAPIWQLCINIYLTMACNVACIGQAPVKWVLRMFGISLLANLILLLMNVL